MTLKSRNVLAGGGWNGLEKPMKGRCSRSPAAWAGATPEGALLASLAREIARCRSMVRDLDQER